jgi:hypothetical protein
MAALNFDPLVNRVKGKLGNFVYKQVGDSVYISKRPTANNSEPSPAQVELRERFRRAALYGKAVIADPVAKAVYAAVAEMRCLPIFSVILTDYMVAPRIREVGLSAYTGRVGETIPIRATDDFQIVAVAIEVSTVQNGIVETSPAVQSTKDPELWLWTAAADATGHGPIQVKITASDRPGNNTVRIETIQ